MIILKDYENEDDGDDDVDRVMSPTDDDHNGACDVDSCSQVAYKE